MIRTATSMAHWKMTASAAAAAILRVAARLKKHHSDEITSGIQAREAVRKARADSWTTHPRSCQ